MIDSKILLWNITGSMESIETMLTVPLTCRQMGEGCKMLHDSYTKVSTYAIFSSQIMEIAFIDYSNLQASNKKQD